ncbi:MAG: leucine-rich repeat domain-containing protein [Flavobacteriaceae bacterium]|nr:leucine-rich repeat domain-containing protein [Flavobacteriaceae bacterium]
MRLTISIFVAFILFSCKDKEELATINPIQEEATINFSYTLAGIVEQSFSKKGSNTSKRASKNIMASLKIIEQGTHITKTVPLIVSLNESDMSVSSDFYTMLSPGIYYFHLQIEYEKYSYWGTSTYVEILEGSENLINIRLFPILGGIKLDYNPLERMTLKFDYSQSDLSEIPYPRVGYKIDNKPEIIVALNTQIEDGLDVNEVSLNVSEGEHNIKLRFFNGAFQIGKSVEAQEKPYLKKDGTVATIDIEPFIATLSAISISDGGNLAMTLEMSNAIVDIVGGIENLDYKVQMFGGSNNNKKPDSYSFIAKVDTHELSINFPMFEYLETSFLFTFTDKRDGSIVTNIAFNKINISGNNYSEQTAFSVADNNINYDEYGGSILLIAINLNDVKVNGVSASEEGGLIDNLGITNKIQTNIKSLSFLHNKGTFTLVLNKGTRTINKVVTLSAGENKTVNVDWFSESKLYLTDYKAHKDLWELNKSVIAAKTNGWDWNKSLSNVTKQNFKQNIVQNIGGHTIDGSTRIDQLNINGIKITQLPTSIGDMIELTSVIIKNTDITEVPKEIASLYKLTRLNLSDNTSLTSVPTEIGQLTNLKTLSFSRSTSLTSLPSEIGQLKNLEHLYITGNTGITCLPQEIWDMTSKYGTQIHTALNETNNTCN